MVQVKEGQCGTCAHFGGDHAGDQQLVQIRITHRAEPNLIEPCGHPDNASHDLKVSPISTCSWYKPGKVA